MRKLLYIALLINFLLVPFQYVKAEGFADADDIFKVVSPSPNSKVGGTINIEWNSFDDDQTSIPYYIQLLDGSTCKTSSYGRINTNSAALSSTSNNNKISWDTHKTITNQSLSDGNYCLQICSAFKKDDAYYSICNARNITIVNVNKLPTISSSPKNLTINESEPWSYQLNASDADSDSLKYYLVFAPDFLTINSSTGLISTKNNTPRISDSDNVAEYRVVVGVDDGVSGTTTQEFTIRIEKGRTPNPIETDNNNNGSTGSNNGGIPQNVTSQISFTSPKENEELKGIQNFIQWSIYDPDGIKEVTLNYSKDLENWTELVTKQEDNFSRYSWDVSLIEDGKYYLQLKVKDKKDEVVAKTSKPFFIKNSETNVIEKKPLIINVKPENTKSLTESPTTITGDFAPAEGEQIDPETFKLSLNDKELTLDCVKNQSGFQCTIKEKLAEGEYKITAEIKDLNGNQGNFESSFTVKTTTKTDTGNAGTSNSNSNTLVIIIVVILLLVVLVGLPWLFIGYTKRKSKQKTTQATNISPVQPANYAYPQAAVTINNQPAFSTPASNPAQNDQSKSFSDFMSSYSFNTQPVEVQKPQSNILPSPVQPPQTKTIGNVKAQKSNEPKTSITDTFKNLKSKVSNFIPKPDNTVTPKPAPSEPVKVNQNPALSQNIQMAYSGGTTASKSAEPAQEFVEPQVIEDTNTDSQSKPLEVPEYTFEPAPVDNVVVPPVQDPNSDEELKRMYPELYGTGMLQPDATKSQSSMTSTGSSSDDYYEPTPKD